MWTYQSARNMSGANQNVIAKPEISHFMHSAIIFKDRTSASDIDALLLGTGYDLRMSFLEDDHALNIDLLARANESYTQGLAANLRYTFPLHRHILSLSPVNMADVRQRPYTVNFLTQWFLLTISSPFMTENERAEEVVFRKCFRTSISADKFFVSPIASSLSVRRFNSVLHGNVNTFQLFYK
jgi:hypothetical protein